MIQDDPRMVYKNGQSVSSIVEFVKSPLESDGKSCELVTW